MQKCKKNILRVLVAFASLLSGSLKGENTIKPLVLQVGGITELTIDSPEGIKVKGSSVHLFQTSASTYKAIGIKPGLSVVDPTPISRALDPILMRVEAPLSEDANCKEVGLDCQKNKISGRIHSLQQIYFINGSIEKKRSDLTSGEINFKDQESAIFGIPVGAIEKQPGRMIIIRGNLTQENQNTVTKALSNLKVVFARTESSSKYVKVTFQFHSDRDAYSKDYSKFVSDPLKRPLSIGQESSQGLEARSVKLIRVENSYKFSFVENFKTKSGDFSSIEGQGNFLWDSNYGFGSFRVRSKSEVGVSDVHTSFKADFDTPTLLSDSILKSSNLAGSTLSPWGHIPILSILFKVFTEKSFDTRSKVWVELLSEYLEEE